MPVTINGSTGVTANVIPNDGSVTQAKLAAGVAGNGPSFSVYATAAQTIGTTYTKIQFNAKEWDTANCFDATTNFRFTPNVAGYYQVNTWIRPNNNYNQWTVLYKNGVGIRNVNGSASMFGLPLSTLVYCNGTTDYLEVYFYSATAINTVPGATDTWFNGFLARAA